VQAPLREDEAIIEYGRFTCYADKQGYESHSFAECYYAFLVTRNSITLIDLDSAVVIDALVLEIINWIGKEENCDVQLKDAFETLMAPFSKLLPDKKKLYIVPDSTLYKLPFELLKNEAGVSVGDKFNSIIYLEYVLIAV
jgi:hypothetical protein